MLRRTAIVLLAVGALPGTQVPAPAMGFRVPEWKTLRQEFAEAKIVIFGTFSNPRHKDAADNSSDGWFTDLTIDKVLKDHAALGKAKLLVLNLCVESTTPKFVVFFDVWKGKLDPYRGVPATPAIVNYLKGALALDPKDRTAAMKYFTKYLEHPDPEIAKDAFLEIIAGKSWRSPSRYDFRELKGQLRAGQVIDWLQDRQIPAERREGYAVLLGHIGVESDAMILRRLIDDANRSHPSMQVALLIGYTLLRPQEGWAYTVSIVINPCNDFTARYSALRAARFFREVRPSLVDQKELLEAVGLLLSQSDIADLAIEDLSRWRYWNVADRVLALWNPETCANPCADRSILRYALSCPKAEALQFVKSVRQTNPELVQTTEEVLKLENEERFMQFAQCLRSLGW
jgi:hypothetical protein